MGAIYCGLTASDGYLFTTNDIFGKNENEGAIVRINKFCGALTITPRGNTLIRLRKVMAGCLANLNCVGDGISVDLAMAIVQSLEMSFQANPDYRRNPLTFLLLLVGCNPQQTFGLEHIFIRNRVVDVLDQDGNKEYRTKFDIQPPIPAKNLFYGHSELSQYLSRSLPSEALDLDVIKLFAYYSMAETQKIDKSLSPNILMSTISEANGFEWIKDEELRWLSHTAKRLEETLTKRLFGSFGYSGIAIGNE